MRPFQRDQGGWGPPGVSRRATLPPNTEKVAARALLAGGRPAALPNTLARSATEVGRALRVLRAVGFLRHGHPAPDASRFLEGLGLSFHTVRVEGEPAFNVP